MRTDTQTNLIFGAQPQWVFKLARLPSPGRCRMQSLTVKALQRTADGLIVPTDAKKPLTLVENQFQFDAEIYLRVVEEMAAAQRQYGMRETQGVIFFGSKNLDPATRPWNSVVRTVYLHDALLELEAAEPLSPLVSVFKPLIEPNDKIVESSAVTYYRAIKESKLTAPVVDTLLAGLNSDSPTRAARSWKTC